MKRWHKNILISGLCLVLLGGVLTGIGFVFGGANSIGGSWGKEQTAVDYYTLDKTEIGSFKNLNIDIRDGDISFVESDKFYLEYQLYNFYEEPVYEVKGEELSIKQKKQNHVVNNLGFWSNNSARTYLTIYLPKEPYQKFKITNGSGDISLSGFDIEELTATAEYGDSFYDNIKSDQIELKAQSGDVSLSDTQVGLLTITNSYGKVEVKNVIGETLNTKMSSGDLEINNLEADNIKIKSSYGDVTLKDINKSSEKAQTASYELEMSSGKLTTHRVHGGTLELDNGYGDWEGLDLILESAVAVLGSGNCDLERLLINSLDIKDKYGKVYVDLMNQEQEYDYDLSTDYGSIYLNDIHKEEEAKIDNSADGTIKIKNNAGNIEIKTRQ